MLYIVILGWFVICSSFKLYLRNQWSRCCVHPCHPLVNVDSRNSSQLVFLSSPGDFSCVSLQVSSVLFSILMFTLWSLGISNQVLPNFICSAVMVLFYLSFEWKALEIGLSSQSYSRIVLVNPSLFTCGMFISRAGKSRRYQFILQSSSAADLALHAFRSIWKWLKVIAIKGSLLQISYCLLISLFHDDGWFASHWIHSHFSYMTQAFQLRHLSVRVLGC